jgi:hypothetical protein
MIPVETLASNLSHQLGISQSELLYKGLLAFIQKEIRSAEQEIGDIRERYNVFSIEELYDAIKDGTIPDHPSWEDYIIWKNKTAHITSLRQLLSGSC